MNYSWFIARQAGRIAGNRAYYGVKRQQFIEKVCRERNMTPDEVEFIIRYSREVSDDEEVLQSALQQYRDKHTSEEFDSSIGGWKSEGSYEGVVITFLVLGLLLIGIGLGYFLSPR